MTTGGRVAMFVRNVTVYTILFLFAYWLGFASWKCLVLGTLGIVLVTALSIEAVERKYERK